MRGKLTQDTMRLTAIKRFNRLTAFILNNYDMNDMNNIDWLQCLRLVLFRLLELHRNSSHFHLTLCHLFVLLCSEWWTVVGIAGGGTLGELAHSDWPLRKCSRSLSRTHSTLPLGRGQSSTWWCDDQRSRENPGYPQGSSPWWRWW